MKKLINTIEGCEVLFDDPNVLIINKPQGLAVQSKNKEFDLSINLSEKLGITLFLITRIDQPVSGIVLYAKTKESAALLSKQLTLKKIDKTYHAIVEGEMPESGVLEDRLSKSHHSKAVENVDGKVSRMSFRLIKKLDRYSIISIQTFSGRFHQIRAQLSINGNPIKGDLKYGAKRSNDGGGIYLHCAELSCFHPISGKKIEVKANYPDMKLWEFAVNSLL